MRIKLLALLALTFAVGCRGGGGGDDGGGDDDGMPIDAPPMGAVKIQDIQNDAMATGTAVSLKGVVVTAIDKFGMKTGDLWVEEPGGGPFSGIKVFKAPIDVLATLAVGDIISISNAEKNEFKFGSDTGSVTEIQPLKGGALTIVKTGTGTVPTPGQVDAAAISMMSAAAAKAEWEKWEGVLITVTNARQISAEKTFGDDNEDQHAVTVSGRLVVETVLAKFPVGAIFGVCYDKITGIGDHFFDDLLLPRSTDDIVVGGAGCRALANNVVALQSGSNFEAVKVTDGFVTAIDNVGTSKGFWVADALAAAPNNGVLVFTGDELPASIAIGSKVSVNGMAQEFDVGSPAAGDTLTEISGVNPADVTVAAGGTVTSVTVPIGTFIDIAAPGEAYEGVLVKVDGPLKVTALPSGTNGEYELTSNANVKIIVDDDSFQFAAGTGPALNACFASIAGVGSVQLTKNIRTLNPRAATDLVAGAGCN